MDADCTGLAFRQVRFKTYLLHVQDKECYFQRVKV
uniref:Uncharacterized protein n=1 Tax=Rhizophora mucronata TaxID=61149 RepID=A0A2P2J0W1_RHIMU